MRLDNLEGIIPNRRSCFDLLCLLEEQYQCSIKFWLTMDRPKGGEVITRVHTSGSGLVFDLVFSDNGPPASIVLESQSGNLYAAIWGVLRQLEVQFRRVMRPEIYPPSP